MAGKTLEKPSKKLQAPRKGEPAWDVALLFPGQGSWSVSDYLALEGFRRVELSEGVLEVLPMPTTSHQLVMAFLFRLLDDFVIAATSGRALPSGTRVQLWPEKYCSPDVVFLLTKHLSRAKEEFWLGADLVMEVVSGSWKDRQRDLVKKRSDYARAGIAEYWIVDPKKKSITVLSLKEKKYEVHGEFRKGMTATSRLLPGFAIDVAEVFARSVQ